LAWNSSPSSSTGTRTTSAGDRSHDAGPRVRSDLSLHVLGDGLRRALREVEQKLATPAEDSAEEARHGEDDVTMRDWLEHFLL